MDWFKCKYSGDWHSGTVYSDECVSESFGIEKTASGYNACFYEEPFQIIDLGTFRTLQKAKDRCQKFWENTSSYKENSSGVV